MLDAYVRRLAAELREIFGTRLTGIYLVGSAATGTWVLGKSDVDVLVACEAAARPQLDAVTARCAHAVIPCPATKLELVVYELDVLRQPRARPRWSLNFDTGAHEHHVGFDPGAEPAHWFVLDLAAARDHAIAVTGPPATTLIGEIPTAVIDAAFSEMVAWYEQNEPAAASLAARRAEHWRTIGRFASKREFAR